MNAYKQTTPQAQQAQPPAYSDRQFMHTYLAGAFLPLAQSLITAAMVMLVTLTILYLFGAMEYFKVPVVLGVLTLVGMWIYLQRRWLKLTALENLLQIDLNGDRQIGEPKVTRIQLDILKEDGHIGQYKFFDLPLDEARLITLFRGLRAGRPFSEREWAGDGKIMSSNEFRNLRSEMIKRDLVQVSNDKDPRQGFELTEAGEAIRDHYASIGDDVQNYRKGDSE